jgi:hypothetical protein
VKDRLGRWLPLLLAISTAVEGWVMLGPLLQLTLVSSAVARRAMGAVLRKRRVAEESQLPIDQQSVSDRSIGHGAPAMESGLNPANEVSIT